MIASGIEIILASASSARRRLLRDAGIEPLRFESVDLDEESARLECASSGLSPRETALRLASLKATACSSRHAGALAIGGDQILEHEGEILSKADSADSARRKLRRLSGSRHRFVSAASCVRDGREEWSRAEEARVTLRRLSDDEIDAYVSSFPSAATECAGGYRAEAEGIRLIESLEGDFHAILGLPLLPLLRHLRSLGAS